MTHWRALAYVTTVDTWFQARIDAAFVAPLHHHPRLGLPALAGWQRILMCVRRMHLGREHFTCIQEFQQQRESVTWLAWSSQSLSTHGRPKADIDRLVRIRRGYIGLCFFGGALTPAALDSRQA